MLDGSGFGAFVNMAGYLANQLLEEADDAFEADDRVRCVSLIERLYGMFDDEQADI